MNLHRPFRTVAAVLVLVVLIADNKLTAMTSQSSAQIYFYVSPSGNDANSGTLTQPFATLTRARDAVREAKSSITQGEITVFIRGGTYLMRAPLILTELDSGGADLTITYRAYEHEQPLLSGGQKIQNWKRVGTGNVWAAEANLPNFRQLYVNGVRQQRARSPLMASGGWYYAHNRDHNKLGFLINAHDFPRPESFVHPDHVAVHLTQWWRDYYMPVQEIVKTDQGDIALVMRQPMFDDVFTLDPPHAQPDIRSEFYVENDLSLLDEPGEWYFDTEKQVVYYMPPENVELSSAEVIAPAAFQLMQIAGSSTNNKVSHVNIVGITFSYAGVWAAPDQFGWFGWQAHMLRRPDYMITPAVIDVENAQDIVFKNNIIEHHGIVGLSAVNGVQRLTLRGNIFRDLGDSAILIGDPNFDKQNETPGAQQKELPRDIQIDNNVVAAVGKEFGGAPGIAVYYAASTTISHNDIADVAYSGISFGWGWKDTNTVNTQNRILQNRISNAVSVTRDGGSIYTQGYGKDSFIEGNYVRNQPNDFAGLYLDEGSAYWTVRNNVVESTPQWLYMWTTSIHHNTIDQNWATTTDSTNKGRDNQITRFHPVLNTSWPSEAQKVIDAAGLEAEYRNLLDEEKYHDNP